MDATTIPGGPDGSYTPKVGDELEMIGQVSESYGMTLVTRARVVMKVTEHAEISKVLEIGSATPPDEESETAKWWEAREGMLLRVPAGSVAVSGRKWGEVWVVPPGQTVALRKPGYDRRVFRDAHPLDDISDKLFDNSNGFRFPIGSMALKAVTNEPLAEIPPVRTFSTLVSDVTGPVWHGYGRFSVQPTTEPAFAEGPDPSQNAAPSKIEVGGEFSVASFNLENLYDLRDDPASDCDHESNPGTRSIRPPFNYVPASEGEYTNRRRALARQMIHDLHSPDIIMVQEAENQDICMFEGEEFVNTGKNGADGQLDALQELCEDIKALGGPRYLAVTDRDGGDERGIICAFLYREDRVTLVHPGPLPLLGASRERLEFSKGRAIYSTKVQNPKAFNATVDGFPAVFDRGPVAACFDIRRADAGDPVSRLYLVNAHFKSGPSDNIARRKLQAEFLVTMMKTIKAAVPSAIVIAGGDLNVQPRPDDPIRPEDEGFPSDQLASFYDGGMSDVYQYLLSKSPASAYTYVYQGQAQTLDQMFLCLSAKARFRRAAVAHINSDWTAKPDYSDSRGASDHDPLVAVFELR
jgi:predicted extracellular nuclease